ncbi:MAG TPA: glycosyltransferase family 39 protein [Candidatus Sulfotelmatobacter sp.]|nr:glycosyltransferase family 39 protein [Candidatus Sulfotelmatobacter sp.]
MTPPEALRSAERASPTAAIPAPRPWQWAAFGVILLLAAGLRFYFAFTTPAWFAEIYIINVCRLPLARLLRLVAADIHPPLQFVMRWVWTHWGGSGAIWHKTFSIVFALGAIALTFAIGRRWLSIRAALLACLLLALHQVHIQYSQEIEEYSLEWFLVLAMVGFAWQWMRTRHALAAYGYVLAAALGLWNHYETFTVWMAVVVPIFVMIGPDWPKSGRWLLINLAVFALFAPLLPNLSAQLARESGGRFFAFPSLSTLAGLWRVMGLGSRLALIPMLLLSLIPLARRETRRIAILFWILLLVSPLATRTWVVILPREGLFILPLWLLLVAYGLESLPWAPVRVLIALALVAFAAKGALHPSRYPEAVFTGKAGQFLAARAHAGDLVVHAEPHSLLYFGYYHPEYHNRLLMAPGDHVPFFEGGLGIPESLYITPDRFREERIARGRWWGVWADRAIASKGVVWRAGGSFADTIRVAAGGDSLWHQGVVTVFGAGAATAK